MSLKYYIQKILGSVFSVPIIPNGRTTGYSLVKSEQYKVIFGQNVKVNAPFFLHNVEIGGYSYLSLNARISNTFVGKFCSIGPNFCCGLGLHPTNGISTSPMFYSTAKQNGVSLTKEDKVVESLHTQIGNDVFIGANVTILDGVTIGDGAVIGAGAVVTKDIPSYAVAVGVPARVIKYRFDEKTVASLLKRRWWDGNEGELKRVERLFWDVEEFLECEG